MPDQQVGDGKDPWDVDPKDVDSGDEEDDADVPDADEAGAGRRSGPRSASVHPEQPVPDESSA
ncbi:hypothetical protein [Streptomyces sp. TRM68416]|uniref:hypothetical protein n=2 Tax=unclassified Streptomyces TaxID=2593676 RepID=UPI001CB6CA0F|nr:hypothetical protein [Streptomyces sp. TRM68416]